MRAIAKWVGIGIAILIVVVLSLPFLINVNQFRPALQSELSTALGRQVTLGNLHLNLLGGAVSADDLSVADDPAFGKPAFLQAKALHVGVELWPFLISRQLNVTDLDIDHPEIVLMQTPKGSWNFSTLGASKSAAPAASGGARLPMNLSIREIRISNGELTFRRTVGHWKPLVLEQVNLELSNFSASSAFPISLTAQVRGGGTVKLDGQAGPLNPSDSSMTPVSFNLNVAGLDLAKSGMNDFAPELAGLVSLKGNGSSDGTKLQVRGSVEAEHLKLASNGTAAARPVEIDFSVDHDLRTHSGLVRQGDVHLGKAVAHLTGTYAEQGEAMVVAMKLKGPSMPVEELAAMLPALGIVLPDGSSLQGGTASADLSIDGPADRLVTQGSLAVNGTRLTGFDMPAKMSSIEKLAGIKSTPNTEIQTLSADIRMAPEGTNAQNMKLVVPAIGQMTGAGTVSPANQLNFKMSAMVEATGMLAAVRNTAIPFTIEGTAAQPVFKPDLKAVAGEEVKKYGGDIGKAAGGLLNGLLSGKKKQ